MRLPLGWVSLQKVPEVPGTIGGTQLQSLGPGPGPEPEPEPEPEGGCGVVVAC